MFGLLHNHESKNGVILVVANEQGFLSDPACLFLDSSNIVLEFGGCAS